MFENLTNFYYNYIHISKCDFMLYFTKYIINIIISFIIFIFLFAIIAFLLDYLPLLKKKRRN